MRIAMLFATGIGSESSNIGSTITAAKTSATAPASLRLALTRSSAAWASLETEGRGLPGGLRGAALSFLENSPIYGNILTGKNKKQVKFSKVMLSV